MTYKFFDAEIASFFINIIDSSFQIGMDEGISAIYCGWIGSGLNGT